MTFMSKKVGRPTKIVIKINHKALVTKQWDLGIIRDIHERDGIESPATDSDTEGKK